jgi:TDG/mug DNA glycosylase family protein
MILPDYLDDDLDAVFCGTAAGNKSATVAHYYAGRGNKFWSILFETGLTAELLTPQQDSRLTEFGLGLTDLVKHHSGNDSTLDPDMYDTEAFETKIREHAPRFVAFNGKEAPAVYFRLSSTSQVRPGLQKKTIGRTRLFVLPSTSGNARRYWDETPWRELAALTRKG